MSFLKTMFNSVARTFGRILAYALIGLAIYFVASHVSASTWVSIYDKTNLNNELAYTGNLSQPLYVCNPATNIRCVTYGTRGTNVINWNSVGYNIKQELTYDTGDNVTFSISFRVSQTGTAINCNNWGMGATAHIDNRLGTQQTINNRSWDRLTCVANVTNNGTQYVATYKFTGSFQASASGTAVSFMFPSNTDSSSLAEILYEVIDITLNAQTDNTNEIINNNTQNSQNIINNQNQNTQDIINNQNQNNQDLIDTINNQNRVCNDNIIYNFSKNNKMGDGYLNSSNGNIISSTGGTFYSDYYRADGDYTTIINQSGVTNGIICFYDSNKTYISCQTFSATNVTFNNPTNTYYIRLSSYGNNSLIITTTYCYDYREKEQETQEEIKSDLQNFLNVFNDISTPSDSEISNSLNGINLPDDTPMTNLLMFPVLLFSFFNNSMSLTCSPVVFGELYGHQLSLPCLNVPQYLGLTLWNIIDLLAMFYMIYNIAHLLIGIFEDISELRSPFLRFFIKNRGALNND